MAGESAGSERLRGLILRKLKLLHFILRYILWRLLRWFGHLLRMEEDRAAIRAYLGRPTGSRPEGRPRYRWGDSVEADLRQLQGDNWQEKAQDREKWSALVSEAQTLFGSPSHITYKAVPRGAFQYAVRSRRLGAAATGTLALRPAAQLHAHDPTTHTSPTHNDTTPLPAAHQLAFLTQQNLAFN